MTPDSQAADVRPFSPTAEAYEAAAAIWNAAYPMFPVTASEVRRQDENRPASIRLRRYLVFPAGAGGNESAAVGFGVYLNREETADPADFRVKVVVHPDHQGRGFGRALFARLYADLVALGARELHAWSREDFAREVRFLRDRGFVEAMRAFESRLDVAAFDPSPFEGLEPRLAADGVRILDLAEVQHWPGIERKVYELHTAVDRDVPMVGEFAKPTFERFAQAHFGDPQRPPEGFILAAHGDTLIGLSEVYHNEADDDLYTGLTGVLRAYRRRGVALAMKLRGIAYAKRVGAPGLRTWNASNNAGMLAVNRRLGFVPRPATIEYIRALAPDGSSAGHTSTARSRP